jgi:hypothetical protein
MKRRQLLKAAAATPMLSAAEWLQLSDAWAEGGAPNQTFSRVRPRGAEWPSEESWERLNRLVEGRLIKLESPLRVCREAPGRPGPPIAQAPRDREIFAKNQLAFMRFHYTGFVPRIIVSTPALV